VPVKAEQATQSLEQAIKEAKLGREEKLNAFKRLRFIENSINR
jgi:hypothetical protein